MNMKASFPISSLYPAVLCLFPGKKYTSTPTNKSCACTILYFYRERLWRIQVHTHMCFIHLPQRDLYVPIFQISGTFLCISLRTFHLMCTLECFLTSSVVMGVKVPSFLPLQTKCLKAICWPILAESGGGMVHMSIWWASNSVLLHQPRETAFIPLSQGYSEDGHKNA